MKSALLTSALLSALPGAIAWGTLGHETVAYIAQNFVTSATATYAKNILGDTSTSYLANVATWADSYRSTAAGKFSAPFHFIDAEDSPPKTCNVDYNRDCGASGCVVSAIANYVCLAAVDYFMTSQLTLAQTKRALPNSGVKSTELTNALKFIIHFLGDIHQPLHDEALEVGGNDISVTYSGKTTNLHHIWDTEIPEQKVGGYALTDAKSWATTLTTAIKSGTYKSAAAGWLDGMDISDPVSSSMIWASDTNAYVCSKVLPNGQAAVESGDLSTTYYNSVIDTVELQIAKAGYRLAAWLNLMATGSTGLKMSKREMEGLSLLSHRVSRPMPIEREAREESRAQLARRAMGGGCGCGPEDHAH